VLRLRIPGETGQSPLPTHHHANVSLAKGHLYFCTYTDNAQHTISLLSFFLSFSLPPLLLPPFLSLSVLHYIFNLSFVGAHLIMIKFYTVNKSEHRGKQ
jgi:hypothetical protein